MSVIEGLFGLGNLRQGVENNLRNQDLDIGRLIGQATVNTYVDPRRQQAYIDQQGAYGALSGMAVRGLGGLFGIEDPQLKRASDLEGILQSTQQELGVDANDPTKFYPTLQQKLVDNGFQREAAQVMETSAKLIGDVAVNQARAQQLQAETALKQQEAGREAQLRTELAALPAGATEADYLAVVRKFAPAKDVMSAIERGQVASENRAARLEEAKLRADQRRQDLELQIADRQAARQDTADLRRELNNANIQARRDIAEIVQSNKPKSLNLTPGQKRADAVFGEEYSNYIALGGKRVVDKQLGAIDEVINMLEQGKNISGPGVATASSLGDVALSVTNKDALKARDLIGGVIQSDLRAVLGGQFAQKEGEQLLARGYNIAASPKDNLKRLKDLRESIVGRVNDKEKSIQYYEETGSLAGFNSKASTATTGRTAAGTTYRVLEKK